MSELRITRTQALGYVLVVGDATGVTHHCWFDVPQDMFDFVAEHYPGEPVTVDIRP